MAKTFIKKNQAGVPTGGSSGQSLVKNSGTDFDYSWGSTLTSVNWGDIGGTIDDQTDLSARLDDFISVHQKGANDGVATLDSVGKIPSSQLGPLAITNVFVVSSEFAQLALGADEGDVVIRTDIDETFIHNGGSTGTMADFNQIKSPTAGVTSVNGQTGNVSLTTDDITEGPSGDFLYSQWSVSGSGGIQYDGDEVVINSKVKINPGASGGVTIDDLGGTVAGLYSLTGSQYIATYDSTAGSYLYGNGLVEVDEGFGSVNIGAKVNITSDDSDNRAFRLTSTRELFSNLVNATFELNTINSDTIAGEVIGLQSIANSQSSGNIGKLIGIDGLATNVETAGGSMDYAIGVRGIAAFGDITIGVYGSASDAQDGPNYAGFFDQGDVFINNNLWVVGGYKDSTGSYGISGQVFTTTGTGTLWADNSSGASQWDDISGGIEYTGGSVSVRGGSFAVSGSTITHQVLFVDPSSYGGGLGDLNGNRNGTQISVNVDDGFVNLNASTAVRINNLSTGTQFVFPTNNATGALYNDSTGVLIWQPVLTQLTIGTTGIVSGTTGRILYDNGGLLGEYSVASGFTTFMATPSSANLRALLTDEVGTGAAYFVGGALGTPASATLTNATGLPVDTGITGMGSGVATFLATPSSANLASAVTGKTGSGALVFGTSPTLTGATLTTTTVNGVTLVTGGTATKYLSEDGTYTTPAGGSSGLTIGSTAISGGSTGRILYESGGVLGEYAVSGSGTTVLLASNPTINGFDVADGTNIAFASSTGTKIGTTTTQKIGFFNATPVVQPSGNVSTALSSLGLVASPTIAFTDITASTSAVIGVGSINLGHASDTTISRVSAGTISVEGVTVLTATNSVTVSGKNLTSQFNTFAAVTNTTSSATPTPTGDSKWNELNLTAQAANMVFAAPSGLATNGNSIVIRVTPTGTFTIGYNAIYEDLTGIAPTGMTSTKDIYIGCRYNSTAVKWQIIAVTVKP